MRSTLLATVAAVGLIAAPQAAFAAAPDKGYVELRLGFGSTDEDWRDSGDTFFDDPFDWGARTGWLFPLSQPVHIQADNDVGSLIGLLCNNPFEEAVVRSAETKIEILPPSQVATLTSVHTAKGEVRAGEPFKVSAVLSPFRGRDRIVSFDVTLPEDTPPGDVQIFVGGGSAMDTLDRRVIERQASQAKDLDDLLRLVGRQRKSHTLFLRVLRRAPSAIVRSDLLPELPLSVFSVFNNPRLSADSSVMMEAPILEIGRDLDLVATGGRRISVKVK